MVDFFHDLLLLLLQPAHHVVVVLRRQVDAGLLARGQQVAPQPLDLLGVLLWPQRQSGSDQPRTRNNASLMVADPVE